MSKRLYKFKVTDAEALQAHCPDAIEKIEPAVEYKANYAIVAKLIAAAELTGQEVPGIEVL